MPISLHRARVHGDALTARVEPKVHRGCLAFLRCTVQAVDVQQPGLEGELKLQRLLASQDDVDCLRPALRPGGAEVVDRASAARLLLLSHLLLGDLGWMASQPVSDWITHQPTTGADAPSARLFRSSTAQPVAVQINSAVSPASAKVMSVPPANVAGVRVPSPPPSTIIWITLT